MKYLQKILTNNNFLVPFLVVVSAGNDILIYEGVYEHDFSAQQST